MWTGQHGWSIILVYQITPHIEPQLQPKRTLEIHESAKTNSKGSDPKRHCPDPSDGELVSFLASGKDTDIAHEAGGKPSAIYHDDVLGYVGFDSYAHEDNLDGMAQSVLITPTENHALHDHQMQLMRAEQQNKKRRLTPGRQLKS